MRFFFRLSGCLCVMVYFLLLFDLLIFEGRRLFIIVRLWINSIEITIIYGAKIDTKNCHFHHWIEAYSNCPYPVGDEHFSFFVYFVPRSFFSICWDVMLDFVYFVIFRVINSRYETSWLVSPLLICLCTVQWYFLY